MAQRKKSYLFSWEQYRNENWWNNLRVETTRRGISINQLLCDLLDRWLAGGDAAPDMLYALNEIRALWDKHGLKPGGKLVALCANGPRQREAFMNEAEHWEDLPAGSFREQGTNVNVALMVLTA